MDSKSAQNVSIEGNIEFRDVSFSYDKKKMVLEHFNLKIKAGQKVGLVGETGCGKSTILSLTKQLSFTTRQI